MWRSRAITLLELELFCFTYSTENEGKRKEIQLTAGRAEIDAGYTCKASHIYCWELLKVNRADLRFHTIILLSENSLSSAIKTRPMCLLMLFLYYSGIQTPVIQNKGQVADTMKYWKNFNLVAYTMNWENWFWLEGIFGRRNTLMFIPELWQLVIICLVSKSF